MMDGETLDGFDERSPVQKTVLLIIDMQVHFADMTAQALPAINTLIRYFRSNNAPIVFTQHGHSEEELTPPFKNQLVKRWGVENSIATGSHPWTLLPEIEEQVRGAPIIAKSTYDAFTYTDMLKTLQNLNVDRVVICGVMTDCCCTTTARSAFNHGFETWLAEDACETVDQSQQETAIDGYEYAYGRVFKTEDILRTLSEERR